MMEDKSVCSFFAIIAFVVQPSRHFLNIASRVDTQPKLSSYIWPCLFVCLFVCFGCNYRRVHTTWNAVVTLHKLDSCERVIKH